MASRPQAVTRCLSLTKALQNDAGKPQPVTMLTEDERMMKETGKN